jgi:AbiV family abortive infection protein
MSVTPEYLLKGYALALEQCGLLLRDACALYESRSFATAMVLAAFAREELGRSKILLGFWRRSQSGSPVTLKEINAACSSHEQKQRAGMLSTVLRGTRETRLGQLLWDSMRNPPPSQAWKDARAALDQFSEKLRKRAPDERHSTRMLALYVEPKSQTEWNRPADKSAKEAYEFLVDATNDYSLRLQNGYVSSGLLQHTDAALYNALMAMHDRPKLPAPVHPSWPD